MSTSARLTSAFWKLPSCLESSVVARSHQPFCHFLPSTSTLHVKTHSTSLLVWLTQQLVHNNQCPLEPCI